MIEGSETPKRGRGRPRKPVPDAVPPKLPRGRPKEARVAERVMTVREYAMTHVFKAIDVMAEIMADEEAPPAARVSAAEKIVTRAIGQPAQANPNEYDTPDQSLSTIRREIVDPKPPAPTPERTKADA